MAGMVIGELTPVKPRVDCWWTVRRSAIWGRFGGGLGGGEDELEDLEELELEELTSSSLTAAADLLLERVTGIKLQSRQ
jgi:hypothetical protein